MNTATLPPMSPRLSARCALALLGAMGLASVIGMLALGPLPAPDHAHRLTDPRTPFGLKNGWSVLLHAPLLLAAMMGAVRAARTEAGPALRRAWTAFFALVVAAALGSMADHVAPSAVGYVLFKVPAASACVLITAIFLSERVSMAWVGPLAFKLALMAGPVGGLVWFASHPLQGQPDYRLLIWLEHLPMLLVPLGVWGLQSRGLRSKDWIVALLWFSSAELSDWADQPIWATSGGFISGHPLHHLPLAAFLASLAWALARRDSVRDARDCVTGIEPA